MVHFSIDSCEEEGEGEKGRRRGEGKLEGGGGGEKGGGGGRRGRRKEERRLILDVTCSAKHSHIIRIS